MTGGLRMSAGRMSLFAAAGFLLVGGASAQAADLGGNCCADLEERIAELEATTARKGNRKVSLTVYGQVNQSVMYWDDGFESNAYVVTNDNSRTRIGFKGDAKIADGWKAGYVLELGIRTANSKRSTQNDPTGPATDIGLDIRHSYWFVDSKKYGRVSLGTTGSAAEGITEINLAATKDIAKYSDVEDSGLGMHLRLTNGALSGNTQWRRLLGVHGDQPGEGDRRPEIKYDTPEIAGFVGTVAWGTDDFWDIGLKWSGEIGAFKIAAGFAYGENTNEHSTSSSAMNFGCPIDFNTEPDAKCSQFGGSISVMHEPTGLYINAAAGELQDDLIKGAASPFAGTNADDTSSFWAVEAGIERKWIPLGKTTLFAQYYDYEGGANERSVSFGAGNPSGNIFASGIEMYGLGVVQGLDSAAMHLYAYYRHYEADLTLLNGGTTTKVDLEDLDVVMGGALIKF
ncbi:porin [Hyphomicrobium sp.]|uniref:porin n=1 Tax=Hyphomicrobium sp. TaxID=82 RepID=UPI002E3387DF|nr:porin [Hyphomicrobium sp.]HEX2839677.1 porin [Hyphomicrobium sp.]